MLIGDAPECGPGDGAWWQTDLTTEDVNDTGETRLPEAGELFLLCCREWEDSAGVAQATHRYKHNAHQENQENTYARAIVVLSDHV